MNRLYIRIAEQLEKVQKYNPDLYAKWYSELYTNPNKSEMWTEEKLYEIETYLHHLP